MLDYVLRKLRIRNPVKVLNRVTDETMLWLAQFTGHNIQSYVGRDLFIRRDGRLYRTVMQEDLSLQSEDLGPYSTAENLRKYYRRAGRKDATLVERFKMTVC